MKRVGFRTVASTHQSTVRKAWATDAFRTVVSQVPRTGRKPTLTPASPPPYQPQFRARQPPGNPLFQLLALAFRHQYALTPRAYVFGQLDYLRDTFKLIDYLVAPTAGVGASRPGRPSSGCAAITGSMWPGMSISGTTVM